MENVNSSVGKSSYEDEFYISLLELTEDLEHEIQSLKRFAWYNCPEYFGEITRRLSKMQNVVNQVNEILAEIFS